MNRLKMMGAMTLLLFTHWASAVPVLCPGTLNPADREFGVEILAVNGVATCFDTGTGNLNGLNSDFPGWTFIEKDGIDNAFGALSLTGVGTTAGTWNILPFVWLSYGELLLGFKSGSGQLDPDWAVFRITPFTVAGLWGISDQQSLSHAQIYGRGRPACISIREDGSCEPTQFDVQEPGTLALLGAGLMLGGLWGGRKRRQLG